MVRPSRFQGSILGRQGQLGAAAIYAAFSLIAGVSAMALAIDTGQLYYAQRDLEKLAGAAALDATRAASGCFTGGSGAPPTSTAALTAAVIGSLQQNLNASVAKDLSTPADFMQPVNGVATVEVGMLDQNTVRGTRTFTPTGTNGLDSNGTDAVRVNLARKQPQPLIPFIFSTATDGSTAGLLRASASAQQTPAASYHIGSTLANVNTSNAGLLNTLYKALAAPAFGNTAPPINISAVSYQGLASATVTAGAIAAQLGLAPVNPDGSAPATLTSAALNAPVTAQQVLTAEAAVLAAQGQSGPAAAVLQIANAATGGQVTSLESLLGGAQQTVVGNLPISALDITTSALLTADQGLYPIKLPSLGIPGTDIFLTVGNPGHAAGLGHAGLDSNNNPRTPNNTAQVMLMVRQSATVPAIAGIGSLGTLKLGVDVTVASASSFLSGISCPSGVNNKAAQATVAVTTAPATVAVGTFGDGPAESAPVTAGPLLTVTLPIPLLGSLPVSVKTNGIIPAQQIATSSTAMPVFTAPFPAPSQTVGGNVNALDVGDAVLNSVKGLGITVCVGATCQGGSIGGAIPTVPTTNTPLDIVVQTIQQTVQTTLANTTSTLNTTVDTLLDGLGAQAGSATVTMLAVNFRNAPITVKGDQSVVSVPRLFNLDNSIPVTSGTR